MSWPVLSQLQRQSTSSPSPGGRGGQGVRTSRRGPTGENLSEPGKGQGMSLLLRSERQRYAVRPPEPVLRRVLSAARAPRQVGHVVLFRHLTRRAIGLPVQGQPTAAGGSGQVGAAVAANPIDRQPFQGRPSVGGVPLLTRGDERRYEPAGPQEVSLQPGSYRPTLLGGGEPKVERGGGGDRSPVRDALAAPPTDVIEEPGVGIICRREQGPAI